LRLSGRVVLYRAAPDVLADRVRPFIEAIGGFGPLFVTAWGGSAVIRTLFRDWKALLVEAGIATRGCHAARHTLGTLIGHRTKSPFAVRDALGHSDRSISISAQYVDRNPLLVPETLNSLFELR
jgi:integrase